MTINKEMCRQNRNDYKHPMVVALQVNLQELVSSYVGKERFNYPEHGNPLEANDYSQTQSTIKT